MTGCASGGCRPAGNGELAVVAELVLQLLDVLLVQVDRLLEGLQPVLDAHVVALVAAALPLLLGELLLRVAEQALLRLELVLEDLAAALVAREHRAARFRRHGARYGDGGNDGDLARHHGAALADGVALDVRVGRPTHRVRTAIDLPLGLGPAAPGRKN